MSTQQKLQQQQRLIVASDVVSAAAAMEVPIEQAAVELTLRLVASGRVQDATSSSSRLGSRTRFVIGSRESELAMIQSRHVRGLLQQRFPQLEFVIQTSSSAGGENGGCRTSSCLPLGDCGTAVCLPLFLRLASTVDRTLLTAVFDCIFAPALCGPVCVFVRLEPVQYLWTKDDNQTASLDSLAKNNAGLFTKTLEVGLLSKGYDIAVHSLKVRACVTDEANACGIYWRSEGASRQPRPLF